MGRKTKREEKGRGEQGRAGQGRGEDRKGEEERLPYPKEIGMLDVSDFSRRVGENSLGKRMTKVTIGPWRELSRCGHQKNKGRPA